MMVMMMMMMILAMDVITIKTHHPQIHHTLTTMNPRQSFLDPAIFCANIVRQYHVVTVRDLAIFRACVVRQDHVVAVRDLAAVAMAATAVR